MYSLPSLKPVRCSMSGSNCCFLTCIQVSQEAGKVVWYAYLFKNFWQFVVIHTVKGFGLINKAEVDVSLEFSCFFDDTTYVGNLISGSSAFSKSNLNICKFLVHVLLKPGLENFDHYFASMWDECCESATLNMPANLENSAVATRLEKANFHPNPKERQCQRMFKLPYNGTHFTC